MTDFLDGVIDRFIRCGNEFERVLRQVRDDQWTAATPCAQWDVRKLVNHNARGNLNYVLLLCGGSAAEFAAQRDDDALGDDPLAGFTRSVRTCVAAYREPGALDRAVDYPLGRMSAGRALAVRTTDNAIHTWDLARAIGADATLDPELVAWIDEYLADIYAELIETAVDPATKHRFFAAPAGDLADDASRQDRLLHLTGRRPKCGRFGR